MARQLNFNGKLFKDVSPVFGGELLKKSHAKTKRPVTTKSAMHVTLRSSMAVNERSFLYKGKTDRIRDVINNQAKRFDIKIYNFAINSNHLHLLVKLQYRDSYNKFIRAISGIIARIALGAEKGKAVLKDLLQRFWDALPFSRIVAWGKDYINTFYYVFENDLESGGFIKYRHRGRKRQRGKKAGAT